MKFIKKIGNISVYVTFNAANDITVLFYDNSDCILSDVCFTENYNAAIDKLLLQLDIVTTEWLYASYCAKDIVKLSRNAYYCNSHYFCKIDNTKYYKHYLKNF